MAERSLEELARRLADLESVARSNNDDIAVFIRRSVRQVVQSELNRTVEAKRSPTHLQNWDPRVGAFGQVDLSASVMDRAKAGGGGASGNDAALYPGSANLLDGFDNVYSRTLTTSYLDCGRALGMTGAPYSTWEARLTPGVTTTAVVDRSVDDRVPGSLFHSSSCALRVDEPAIPVTAPSIVQTKEGTWQNASPATTTFTSAPTTGNRLVVIVCADAGAAATVNNGYTLVREARGVGDPQGDGYDYVSIYTKVAGVAESSNVTTTFDAGNPITRVKHVLYELTPAVVDVSSSVNAQTGATFAAPALTVTRTGVMIAAFVAGEQTYIIPTMLSTPTAPLVEDVDDPISGGRYYLTTGHHNTVAGSYTPTTVCNVNPGNDGYSWGAVAVNFGQGPSSHTATLRNTVPVDGTTLAGGAGLPYAYLVAGAVLYLTAATTYTQAQVTLQIEEAVSLAVMASASIDLLATPAGIPVPMFCASSSLSPAQRLRTYRWKLDLAITTTGAGNTAKVSIQEAVLVSTPSLDFPTFSPIVAAFIPTASAHLAGSSATKALAVQSVGDTLDRLEVTGAGELKLGSGAAAVDTRLYGAGSKRVIYDDGAGGAAKLQIDGPAWVRGPADMDLDVTYASAGKPGGVTRLDDLGAVSTTVITYTGANVASVVTTRFGKTMTVTPIYTGADITHIDRVVA